MTASIIVLLAIVAIATIWRLASRRRSLPCPVWLRWLVELDNPFTKTNRAAYIVETLAISTGMSVLDAAFFIGLYYPLTVVAGGRFTGFIIFVKVDLTIPVKRSSEPPE